MRQKMLELKRHFDILVKSETEYEYREEQLGSVEYVTLGVENFRNNQGRKIENK